MDVRWVQRLQNLERAVDELQEAIDQGIDNLSDLEKQGTIQRFEIAVELAWKTIKDYLEAQGTTFETIAPRPVLKDAFAAGLLDDGQAWQDMVRLRNLLSHRYDKATFEEAVREIAKRFVDPLASITRWLQEKRDA